MLMLAWSASEVTIKDLEKGGSLEMDWAWATPGQLLSHLMQPDFKFHREEVSNKHNNKSTAFANRKGGKQSGEKEEAER